MLQGSGEAVLLIVGCLLTRLVDQGEISANRSSRAAEPPESCVLRIGSG
jgi:hypothetical protein